MARDLDLKGLLEMENGGQGYLGLLRVPDTMGFFHLMEETQWLGFFDLMEEAQRVGYFGLLWAWDNLGLLV